MRETGKPFRMAYERFSLSDDLVLLCVPEWFRAALLDSTQRFLWSRVWETDGTAVTLNEEDRKRVEYGIYKLSQEECDMEIINNVTVTCGGCGGTPTTIYCILPDGTPQLTPQPPVEPTVPPPVGDAWPVDPFIDPVPDGFGDWTTFDVEACAAANGLWQAVYALVTVAEGAIDLLAIIAGIVVLLAAGLAAEIVAAIGGSSLFAVAQAIAQILVSEQASDILNEAKLWLETEKEEIVCWIFANRFDIPQMQIGLMRMWYTWVGTALTLDDVEQDAVREFGKSIWPLSLLLAYLFEYQRYIDSSAPIDCSTCAEIGGMVWTPSAQGTWCAADPMDYTIYANGLTMAGLVAKGSEFGSYEYTLTASMDPAGPTPFSNRNLTFFNDNSRDIPCIITATTDGGPQQVIVQDGTSNTLDLLLLSCTAIQFKWQIGIYTLSCPQALSGYVTWADV